MRRVVLAAVAALLVTGVSACTGTDDPAVPSVASAPTVTEAPADRLAQELEFVACMRAAGITSMPDPVPGDTSGRSAVRYAIDVLRLGSDETFQAALDGCVALLPEPKPQERADEDEVEALRQTAQCMRDNGVPDFPDPVDGELKFGFYVDPAEEPSTDPTTLGVIGADGVYELDLGNPVVVAAWQACQDYYPAAPDPQS